MKLSKLNRLLLGVLILSLLFTAFTTMAEENQTPPSTDSSVSPVAVVKPTQSKEDPTPDEPEKQEGNHAPSEPAKTEGAGSGEPSKPESGEQGSGDLQPSQAPKPEPESEGSDIPEQTEVGNDPDKQTEVPGKGPRTFNGSVNVVVANRGDIHLGDRVTLKAKVKGAKGVDYELQWETNDGSGWTRIDDATDETYSFIIDARNGDNQWRVGLTALEQAITSEPIDLSGKLMQPDENQEEPVEEVGEEVPEEELPIVDPTEELTDPEEPTEVGDPIKPVVPDDPEEPTGAAEPTEPEEPTTVQGIIVTDQEDGQVNLRETPSLDGAIIMTIPSGATLTVIRYEGDWAFVEYEGVQGYVAARYVGEPVPDEPEEEEKEPAERGVSVTNNIGATVSYGDVIVLTGHLMGYDDVDYVMQWQVNEGDGWKDLPGERGISYSFVLDEHNIDYGFRLGVTVVE